MGIQDRYQGALLGLAVGDALSTTMEFKPLGTFEPITGVVGGGPLISRVGKEIDNDIHWRAY